jgi:hypothetical protein
MDNRSTVDKDKHLPDCDLRLGEGPCDCGDLPPDQTPPPEDTAEGGAE